MLKYFLYLLLFTSLSNLHAQKLNWQSFNSETLKLAKQKNKHILLHLAANWCHWCHVMEEKTYSNPEVINYLNKYFIVCYEDHDKRPDLANRYRDYGWPATIIFNPNAQEVFKEAGYIEAKEFLSILKKIKTSPSNLISNSTPTSPKISGNRLFDIKNDIYSLIDTVMGGFQSPQKSLDFEMFEYAINHQHEKIFQKWLSITLPNSLNLLDTVLGGVYQYSTHNDWVHQHYEKLLTVQARYIKMYLWYYYITDDKKYFNAAIKIKEYVQKFFKHKSGGYSNAQDADLIKGIKGTDFFKLNNEQRLSKGIPAIDSTITTEGNAKLAESFCYLYAYTGDKSYLKESIQIIQMLMKEYKSNNGLYKHIINTQSPDALIDQLSMIKTLITLFKFTQDSLYIKETERLITTIKKYFWSDNYFLSFIKTESYLEPQPVVSENIEAARLINFYAKITKQKDVEQDAIKIFKWLCSDEIYKQIIIEPGIVSLSEEINTEPYSGLYAIYQKENENENIKQILYAIPKFYYMPLVADNKNIPEDKKELLESFDKNVVLFCTSNFCSAPMFTENEVKNNTLQLLFFKH